MMDVLIAKLMLGLIVMVNPQYAQDYVEMDKEQVVNNVMMVMKIIMMVVQVNVILSLVMNVKVLIQMFALNYVEMVY